MSLKSKFCHVCTPISEWPSDAEFETCSECAELLADNSGYNPEDLDAIIENDDPDDIGYLPPEEISDIISCSILTECTSIKEYIINTTEEY